MRGCRARSRLQARRDQAFMMPALSPAGRAHWNPGPAVVRITPRSLSRWMRPPPSHPHWNARDAITLSCLRRPAHAPAAAHHHTGSIAIYSWILLLHLLGASVWVGGHLVLALGVLPGVLRQRDVAMLLAFESRYERIGMAALAMQIVTGLALAWRLLPDVPAWFAADSAVSRLILLKLGLLAMTALVAAHARLRVIPRLQAATLPLMAAHVAAVTVLSVLFVAAGISLRTGWLG